MRTISFRLIPALIWAVLFINRVSGQQEYGWRGPGRTGICNETGLLKSWPAAGPKLVWEAEGISMGHSSATVTSDAVYITGVRGDKDVLTAFTLEGRKKWDVEYGKKSQAQNYPESRCTPAFAYGKVFVVSGAGELTCVSPEGKSPELVWKNPEINPHVGGMVLIGNYLYSSTHDNNSFGRWICVDWNTGKTMWTASWNNKGSVISADGMLYFYEERHGNAALVKPNQEKLEIVSEFRVEKGTGPYWAHPSISNGVLYLRHGEALMAYNIKE